MCTLASTLNREEGSFSTMAWRSITSSKCRVMRRSLAVTYSRMAGVISIWCPVRWRFMGVLPGLKGFSQVGGQYLQGLAVLGDGATRHHDALLRQYLRNLPVGERLARVFRGHQLLDQGADRGARGGAAGFRGDVAAEEILELEDAARGVHELLRRDARDRGLVQVER